MTGQDTKYKYCSFQLFNYRSVEKTLTKMAEKGWELAETGNFFWRFERCQPVRKKFEAVYARDISEYNPLLSEGQVTLESLCDSTGWEKVGTWKQMEIYATEDEDALPLMTDETVRLASIRAAMKVSYIKTWILTIILMLTIIFRSGYKYFYSEPGSEVSMWIMITGIYGALAVICMILSYFLWVLQSKKNISAGGKCAGGVPNQMLSQVLVLGLFVPTIGYLTSMQESMESGGLFAPVVGVAIFCLIIPICISATRIFREKGYSKEKNIMLSVGTTIIASILMAVIVFIIVLVMAIE